MAAQAESGMALIMDSRTGELLAVAQLTMPTPTEPMTMQRAPCPARLVRPARVHIDEHDGTNASLGSGDQHRQRPTRGGPSASAFTTVYEPGSVEKLVTVSAALSAGAIQPGDYFSIPDTYDVAGSIFSDAWPHPRWTGASRTSLPILQTSARSK